MVQLDTDERLRVAALVQADALRREWGDRVPAYEIENGFSVDGERIRFVGPGMGVFKPKQLTDGPISIRTSLAASYRDEPARLGQGIRYDFAPRAREYDNDGLKRLCELGRPLIYLIQVAPRNQGSEYAIVSPVFVVGWDESRRTFDVAFRPHQQLDHPPAMAGRVRDRAPPDLVVPEYRIVELRARLHQAHFRRLVLHAYRQRCAVCELQIRPLLEAAHIVPDSDGGSASVNNGLGLCVLHHRAFDCGILGVTTDFTVSIDDERLHANDRFAEQALRFFDGRLIALPRREEDRPSPEALSRRMSG